jgi:hypothetical protein
MARPKKDAEFVKKAIEGVDENDTLGPSILFSGSEGEQITYTVIAPFRDKDNFDIIYSEGDDVSNFDKERIEYCIEQGLVKANDK